MVLNPNREALWAEAWEKYDKILEIANIHIAQFSAEEVANSWTEAQWAKLEREGQVEMDAWLEKESKRRVLIGGGEGYGCSAYRVGEYIYLEEYDSAPGIYTAQGTTSTIDAELEPGRAGWYIVVDVHANYFPEDGWNFGVGAESGYIYHALLRPATPEEAVPEEAARLERIEMFYSQKAFEKRRVAAFTEGGEQLWGEDFGLTEGISGNSGRISLNLNGETVPIDEGQNMYGGGQWFLIDADGLHVWYVANNGSDGADWSYNNIRTGGAGAIGYRFPLTAERRAVLEDLKRINANQKGRWRFQGQRGIWEPALPAKK